MTHCALSPHNRDKGSVLDHHLYNQLTDTLMKQPSQHQPYIKLQFTVDCKDHTQFGLTPRANQHTVTVHTTADTWCQSCLMGISMVRKLGLHRCNLIPIMMEKYAENDHYINILVGAILRFSGQNRAGNTIKIR